MQLSLLGRLSLNLRIFLHCLRIVRIVKSSSFKECLQLLQKKDSNHDLNTQLSENYLSKKINFYNKLIFSDNCFTKSLCFFTFFNSEKSVSLNIGVRKNIKQNIESHSWIEINDAPVNEPKDINTYKLIFKTRR